MARRTKTHVTDVNCCFFNFAQNTKTKAQLEQRLRRDLRLDRNAARRPRHLARNHERGVPRRHGPHVPVDVAQKQGRPGRRC